jgi:uncharacterized metal-binding protein
MEEPIVKDKALIITCSGVGKVHGLIAREVALRVADEVAPDAADTLCLALLVKGDEEAVAAVRARPCITVDGCPKLCSQKNVTLAGGRIARSLRVVDEFKNHKGARPGDATTLAPDGWTITEAIAADVSDSAATCELPAAHDAQSRPLLSTLDSRPSVPPDSSTPPLLDSSYVGIIACAGEDLPEGTISRLAVRKVMEELRPDPAVTVCLPLFLAGDAGEQEFARTYPTITIDGCDKQCARCGTEKHSGPVAAALVVTDLLKDGPKLSGARSGRLLTDADRAAVDLVAQRIAEIMDRIAERQQTDDAEDVPVAEGTP